MAQGVNYRLGTFYGLFAGVECIGDSLNPGFDTPLDKCYLALDDDDCHYSDNHQQEHNRHVNDAHNIECRLQVAHRSEEHTSELQSP